MAKGQGEETSVDAVKQLVPIVDWLRSYDRRWLRPDVIAGVTVAALVVPKALGYASIAGVPIQHGLYAAAAGALLYAVFGTSRQIATGPSSALSAVAAGALVSASIQSGGDEAVQMVSAITLASGLLFLLLAVLKMGWVSRFLSKAVITGFLFGAAIEVLVGELGQITGTQVEGDNAWGKFLDWLSGLGDSDSTTLVVGVVSLVIIFGLRFIAPKVPGALVLVVLGLLASLVFDLGDRGVELIGEVPRGLVAPVLPSLEFVRDNLAVIVTASVGLLLIGFSQTAGDAKAFASKHGYNVDIDQESVAQGACNVGSGLLQGIPVSTSLSASSLNDGAGAKTQMASLTTGVAVILTLVALAPLFSDLPKAVLAAIIIEAVVMGMMDVPAMRRLFRVNWADFWIAMAALLGVLAAGVLAGVVLGVLLSLGRLIYLSAFPPMAKLGREPGTQAFVNIEQFPEAESYPGLLVLRFDAGLYFSSCDAFEEGFREQVDTADRDLQTVVLDLEGVNIVDSQGTEEVGKLVELAERSGVELRLARVKGPVLAMLERDGVIEQLGRESVYSTVYDAAVDRIERTD